MTRVWDCHTDILSKLLTEPVESFRDGRGDGEAHHYDLPRLEAGGVSVMVCALFCRDDTAGEDPVQRTLRMIDRAHRIQALTEGRVEIATDTGAVDRIVSGGRTALVLSIENGIACLDKLELLRTYHRLGVRAMGLTWNGRNYLADGCRVGGAHSRLTPFGCEAVAAMQELGMVIDLSHAAEGVFWDVLERADGPLICSHSNVQAFTAHPRNLTDAQLRALADRGGVCGVNFYPGFLRDQPEGPKVASAETDDLVRHLLGLLERAGEDAVGIGSDFDGIEQGPGDMRDPSCYPRLRERLRREGLSDETLSKVFYGNFRRVFGAVMG